MSDHEAPRFPEGERSRVVAKHGEIDLGDIARIQMCEQPLDQPGADALSTNFRANVEVLDQRCCSVDGEINERNRFVGGDRPIGRGVLIVPVKAFVKVGGLTISGDNSLE